MSTHNQDLNEKVREKHLDIEAAKLATAPLLKTGWMLVFGGWALGLIPVIGVLGWATAFFGGIVVGIIAITRGNATGGLLLAVTAWLGTAIVALVEIFIWMFFGFAGFGGLAMLENGL